MLACLLGVFRSRETIEGATTLIGPTAHSEALLRGYFSPTIGPVRCVSLSDVDCLDRRTDGNVAMDNCIFVVLAPFSPHMVAQVRLRWGNSPKSSLQSRVLTEVGVFPEIDAASSEIDAEAFLVRSTATVFEYDGHFKYPCSY